MIDVAGLILALMWLSLGGVAVYSLGGRALRSRRAAAALVATFLVAFIAGYAAHRHGAPVGVAPPPAQPLAASTIAGVALSPIPAPGSVDRVVRSPDGTFTIAGWIGDPVRSAPGLGVFVLLDGSIRAAADYARYGLDRPDVGRVFANANLVWSGFELAYAPGALAPGTHYLQVILVSSDGRSAYLLPRRVMLTP